MNCTVCDKIVGRTDKVSAASCGHLIHINKTECLESNFCSICKEEIKISNTPVKLYFKDADPSSQGSSEQSSSTNETPEVPDKKKNLDFIRKQLEWQREIINQLIGKIKTTNICATLIKDQQVDIKKILLSVLNLQADVTVMKGDILTLKDQFQEYMNYDEEDEESFEAEEPQNDEI